MFGCQKQGGERTVRMTDHHNLAEVERVDEGRRILRVHEGGVAPAGRINVRIVVAPTVRDRPIMFGERAELVGPVPAVAQRTVDEDHGRSFALFHVVQCDAVPNIGCSDDRRIGVLLHGAMGRELGENDHYSDKAYGRVADLGHNGLLSIPHSRISSRYQRGVGRLGCGTRAHDSATDTFSASSAPRLTTSTTKPDGLRTAATGKSYTRQNAGEDDCCRLTCNSAEILPACEA